MNTQNNEWRDLLPGEKLDKDAGDYVASIEGTMKWRTRRPLPSQAESCTCFDSENCSCRASDWTAITEKSLLTNTISAALNNTQNNEWRDMHIGELIHAGDEFQNTDGEWKPVSSSVGDQVWPEDSPYDSPYRTRRPLPTPCPVCTDEQQCWECAPDVSLPTPNISSETPNISEGTPNTSDPIAAAIKQMEEAAKVLKGFDFSVHIIREKVIFDAEKDNHWQEFESLSEALGYKSPQHEREEKLKEADAKMQKAKDLFDKANEIEAQAAELIEEAAKLREEATDK